MATSTRSVLDHVLNWRKVTSRLQEYSEDATRIEELVNQKVDAAIKASHPNDFNEFVARNRKELDAMKEQLKKKYGVELKGCVSLLSGLSK